MQNDFIDGSLGTKEAQEIVTPGAEKIRNFEGDIYGTLDIHEEDYLSTQEGKNLPVKHCICGEDGWALNSEIIQAIAETKAEVHNFYRKGTFGSMELAQVWKEKYEDQAVKDFRKIIADKKETRKEPAAPSVFSYGLTACLAIAVLTVGVNFYRSYQNVKQNEKESATVSSVIVEEITPSPVVGTSNNEAVRQHKQYRTDTIQNDAGKNKKNNEENDEENNQSTSEKENSEKKNNTSEKKISAEQTDTEQKSDKTEQLPDVKTEKADKTEQIYQQEADERKAQKRVREAVQKENSEAAGKAHESYVIQPGDTLFQISMDRYGSVEAIAQICALNGITADQIIYPGEVIVLP